MASRIWSKEQAWRWYRERDWVVGCNFIPSDCSGTLEIWQAYNHNEVRKTMEKELALAAYTGINSLRMLLPYGVWQHEHDGFMQRFDAFLDLIEAYGMTLMPIFFDDCGRGPIEQASGKPRFGKQPEPVPGHHGGFPSRSREHSADPSYHMADNRNNWPEMERFVKEMVGKYREDKRILAWDIWNEPGNSGAGGYGNVNKSLEAMEAAFAWAREMDPVQPLTAAPWDFYHDYFERCRPGELTPIEERAVALSDVVSFHYYGPIERSEQLIEAFQAYGRPLFITEWLHRPFANHVHDHLPLYRKEGIACFHWGLVNGKTQTHEPWDWIQNMDLDFSSWQHDLYNRDGSPYRHDEIETFRKLTGKDAPRNGDDSMNSAGQISVSWEPPVLIHDIPAFEDLGVDARYSHPGKYGSQYGRMVFLKNGTWLTVYTIYDNNGYTYEASGGNKLEFAISRDEGQTWERLSQLGHPSRDMDNGQLIELDNGDLLLSCRSVRWHESYQLHVYKSTDGGRTWAFWSTIDELNGSPGSLGNPDKGVYEPHFYRLADGRLSVMYANEKHVIEPPYYSQIISQKISEDDGRTWGEEIWVAWDPASPHLRPGMPVWTRLQDGRYIVVLEVVHLVMYQCVSAAITYKISNDGVHWEAGNGTPIPAQHGGPYVEQLQDGTWMVTSNSGQISVSRDSGASWQTIASLPFASHLWPSLYALDGSRFLLLNSAARPEGGHNIQMCIGQLK
ncbi:exo-alpha-sialidase [Cohnella cellulosilytica]|uniref:Exo-alpha-sialidase n=1 Tax=Cohnella cellulosilytica TaxID=986710 RepID=A0ABW2FEE9_9BACL